MYPHHINPEDAVQIHMDIESKKSFAVHWGTFVMTYEVGYFHLILFILIFIIIWIFFKHYLEPPIKLAEALKKFALDKSNFITLKHGDLNEFD